MNQLPRPWSVSLQAALDRSRLAAEGDPGMDRLAAVAARIIGSEVALVSIVTPDRQVFPGRFGLPAPLAEERQTPLSHSICRYVVTDGELVQIDDTAADQRTVDHPARTELGIGSYLGAPIADAEGNVLGSLCAFGPEPRAWTAEDRELITDLAKAAGAEVRARIAATLAEEAARRLRFVADAGERLAASLDTRTVLETTLDLFAPPLAGRCQVYLPAGDGRPRRLLAAGGAALTDWTEEADGELEAVLLTEAVNDVLSGAAAWRWLEPDEPAGEWVLVLPLVARGEILGACFLSPPPGATAVAEADVAVLVEVGRRAGTALHNARVYGRERQMAVSLQRSLLTDLPDISGLEMFGVYQPALIGVEVGGDWFDVASTPAGPVAISVGDVTGHDVASVAAMGRLSGAIRCYAHDGFAPDEILRKADGFDDRLLGELYATCVCASATPEPSGTWRIAWANAGQVPPLVVPASADPYLLDSSFDLMLGLGSTDRTSASFTLAPGDTLLLYTDGLLEHRDEPLADALLRLVAVARDLDRSAPVAELCQDLLLRIRPAEEDDLALLAVRSAP